MKFTPEHEELKRTVKRFCEEIINPNVKEWEKAHTYPAHEVCKAAAELGLLGIHKPEKYGGMGLDYTYEMCWSEALGWANCGGVPMSLGVVTDMATPALARFGTEELCNEFLAPVIAGDMVPSIAVSEPHAGSDVANIKTTAVKDGDDYIINGSKMWITNGTQADWACTLVNTSEGHRHSNKSLVVIPLNEKGVDRNNPIEKVGMWASDTTQIFFDNVRIPQRNLIGQEGAGFMYQMVQFQEERMFAAAGALCSIQRCIDETIEYCRTRKTFGQPLIDNQWIHFRMAELQTELECLRALTWNSAERYVGGEDMTLLASHAKLKAGRLVREVADACMQFWGGQGYTLENITSQVWRDGRLSSIGGGADEIMLGIICKLMGILPGKNKEANLKAA